ncbi:hypothetical protein H7827_03330 [Streptomyces sp. JH002]|uniref:hypothetical protein n=1 Tax=Streptomyces sp. JH002 TaxID=2763259 RepID=UPI003D8084B6
MVALTGSQTPTGAGPRRRSGCRRVRDQGGPGEGEGGAQREHPEYAYAPTALDAVRGADPVVLASEWPQYTRDPKLRALAAELVGWLGAARPR